MVIGYYSGTLRYANLYRDKHVDMMFGEGVMSVSIQEFQIYAVHVSDEVKDSNMKSCYAQIGPEKSINFAVLMLRGTWKAIGLHQWRKRQMGEKPR